MNKINETMQELGLDRPVGTTELDPILEALESLSEDFADHADLFIVAADVARAGRTAGTETIEDNSVFAARRKNRTILLRYRNEMMEMFTDLMIDLALRGALNNEVSNAMGQEVPATSGAPAS